MAHNDELVTGLINYYFREKYYGHVRYTVDSSLGKYVNDPLLKFYSGLALLQEDRTQEGMRELQLLKDDEDVNISSTLALLSAHKSIKQQDKESIQQLDTKLKSERKHAGEMGLYYAAQLLFFIDKHDKAREYIDRCIKMSPLNKKALALKGWIELTCDKESSIRKSVRYFDEVLGMDGPNNIDAVIGKARYLAMNRNYSNALELINSVVVEYPKYIPALVIKIEYQMALQEWDLSLELSHRILALDKNNIDAQVFQILYNICKEGDYNTASNLLAELIEKLDRKESKNAKLYLKFAQVFSRICGRNSSIIQQTHFLVERAIAVDSGTPMDKADRLVELGRQLLFRQRNRDAVKCYRNAMKIDETNVIALTGIIKCQIYDGFLDDASQQLEFLSEIQNNIGFTSELFYLSGLLAMKKEQNVEIVLDKFHKALECHFASLRGIPLGTAYFCKLDPDLLLQITADYLTYVPQKPSNEKLKVNSPLLKCSKILETITKAIPGLHECLFLIGKVKFLSGDMETAQSILQKCINQDNAFSDAHILMAQIQLYQNNFKAANQSLEVGLSYNFEVRERPLYHLIRSRIFRKQNDIEEAARTLQLAMTLPGVKNGDDRNKKQTTSTTNITLNDRVSVFLELVEAYQLLEQPHEAAKVLQDAIHEFKGTSEEVRVTIANCDVVLESGDIEGALSQLQSVESDQGYYVEARQKMADIYLKYRKDKRLYASCYRELVEKHPSPQTFLLLGDAYISIQEPERAIEVYESALKKNPRDSILACKIGKALVKTHNYGKAINYYEAALKSSDQPLLRRDLAELLLRLKQYDKAEKILTMAIKKQEDSTDLEVLTEQTHYYLLLFKVMNLQERINEGTECLEFARDIQIRVLKRVEIEQSDSINNHRELLSRICRDLAKQSNTRREYDKSIRFYKESLIYSPEHAETRLELAKLYMIMEDVASCEKQCMTLLQADNSNDHATMMLADLMFQKNNYEQAMHHFQQVLERSPGSLRDHMNNYEVQARLVRLMRWAGKLSDVKNFLDLDKENDRNPGYNYVRGLYEWFIGNTNVALKFFNKARKDEVWGVQSVYNMIEICLNPDNVTLGGEVFNQSEFSENGSEMPDSTDQLAIKTAEKLIDELKCKHTDSRTQTLRSMLLVASKKKINIEKALLNFTQIIENDSENVSALYGMAAAYMMMKQAPRARNALKKLADNPWTIQDAEDLEKSWLLLSDIYVQSNKYDLATDLLNKCLKYNKTCTKAYEYMGYIEEKEQNHANASNNYQQAWKYSNENNPTIGYKLSFNYLKAKRYTDAIDTCQKVLKSHPNYPKIRKDILDKARMSIRI